MQEILAPFHLTYHLAQRQVGWQELVLLLVIVHSHKPGEPFLHICRIA